MVQRADGAGGMSGKAKTALGHDPLDELDGDTLTDLLPPRRRRRAATQARTVEESSGDGRRREQGVAGEEEVEDAARRPQRSRVTADVDSEILERARAAVYWTPGLTLKALVEKALRVEVKRLESERGRRFPDREGPLPPGRPLS